jgi:hypothetical protein
VQFDNSNPGDNSQEEPSKKSADHAGAAGVTPDNFAPVEGAYKRGNGHDANAPFGGAHEPAGVGEADDVPQSDPGPDEAEADSGISRVDSPCADGDGAGDTLSAKAHAENRRQVEAQILTLYDVPPLPLEFNFDEAHRHLEVIGRANGRVLLQTFDK